MIPLRQALRRHNIGPTTAQIALRCLALPCSHDSFPVAANCFDDELQLTNLFHEFVKEKPTWYGICDEAKQFLEHPHQ